MANIKWSGIEQTKYGLTARWYVSAQYGNDTDVDVVGLYNPSTNVTGHGGPTRPFKTIDMLVQTASSSQVAVLDSGYYKPLAGTFSNRHWIGDGNVIFDMTQITAGGSSYYRNMVLIGTQGTNAWNYLYDCTIIYGTLFNVNVLKNCTLIEVIFSSSNTTKLDVENNTLVRCSGSYFARNSERFLNNLIINCPDLQLGVDLPRPIGNISDYSIIIGTVKTSSSINSKTTGVTIEDFKIDGNYFSKSFSEVDLFGNASGSGASLAQLQTIFNNYFSPIYLDNWQYSDLSLKPTVDDHVRYGGLSGHFIGALPVGYSYDINTLWNTYKDNANTSNVELDAISGNLVLSSGQTTGIFTTTEIVLPDAIEADVAMFFKNNVYNSSGIAVQRIDTTDDAAPSNSVEQRTVYSYRLKTSPDSGTALGVWKEYEIDRAPTVDASGNSNINDSFDKQTETTQIIKKFALEITLRDLS